MHIWSLYYGYAQAPLAQVVPDKIHPDMYRIRWPGGSFSDMTNISRAKNAAIAFAERGPPARNRRRLRWERSKTAAEAPPTAQIEPAYAEGGGASPDRGGVEVVR